MSSDDEFASYAPTTPYKYTSRTIQSKSNTDAIPGPSSKPAAAKSKRRRSPRASETESGAGAVEISSGQEDDVQEVPAPTKGRGKGKRATARSQTPATNGVGTGKGKGKAKADPVPKRSRNVSEPLDVDDVELFAAFDELTKNRKTTNTRPAKKVGSLKEMERVLKRLRETEEHRDAAFQQLQEERQLHDATKQALGQLSRQHEAERKTLEELVGRITNETARANPLAGVGNASVCGLITHREAHEKQRIVESENEDLRRELEVARDEVSELSQILKETRFELKAQQDKTSALQHLKPPPSTSKSRVGGTLGNDDPKNAVVVRFYEDVTNLLVMSVKIHQGQYFDFEDCTLTCVYTHVESNAGSGSKDGKSMSFTLRLFHALPNPESDEPVVSRDQLVKTVHYVPLELDKESDDFVYRLGFLNKPFTFQQHQLPLFLSQIYEKLGTLAESGEENDDQQMDNGE